MKEGGKVKTNRKRGHCKNSRENIHEAKEAKSREYADRRSREGGETQG